MEKQPLVMAEWMKTEMPSTCIELNFPEAFAFDDVIFFVWWRHHNATHITDSPVDRSYNLKPIAIVDKFNINSTRVTRFGVSFYPFSTRATC